MWYQVYMRIEELDKVFKVDISKIELLDNKKSPTWGNLDPEGLSGAVFNKMASYFPDLNKVSPDFRKKVEQSICLAFLRLNEHGQLNYPIFKEFLTCSQMSVSDKVVKNIYDEKMYRCLFKMWITEEVELSQ